MSNQDKIYVSDLERGNGATEMNPSPEVADTSVLPLYKTDSRRDEHKNGSSSEKQGSEVDGKERITVGDAAASSSVDAEQAEGQEGKGKWSMSEIWARYRVVFHLFFAAVILGWWISGLVLPATRHKWVVTTIFSWFFLGLIFFQYIPTKVFSEPIAKTWDTLISKPFFAIPYYGRLALGWISLLALILGSAFGVPLPEGTGYGDRAISCFGLLVFQSGFFLTSRNRKAIQWDTVIVGLGFQMIIALFVLKTDAGYSIFLWIANLATDFLGQAYPAAAFFFDAETIAKHWFFVNVLAAIIFFIAFVQLLYYYGIMQWVIKKFAWFFFRTLRVSGAEAVVAAASPFIGQGESACMVKPYVQYMTPAEIHQTMTSGFATIAGSVLAAYVSLGMPAQYLVTASVMSIPCSIAISKLRFPEEGEPLTKGRIVVARDSDKSENGLQAFSNGAWFGLLVAGKILCNVLVVLALLNTVDGLLTWIGQFWGIRALTLEFLFSYIFYPVSWLMGVPKQDLLTVSRLLGTKLVANEFVAYASLSTLKTGMTQRGFTIAVYSLCGFANLSSLGIQIGVLGALAPSQRTVITKVGVSALLCGFISTVQSATIAGMLL